MSKLILIIAGVAVTAGIVTTVAIERRLADQQRAQKDALREQAGLVAQAAAENARLSNLVARAATSQSISPEQLTELLRLRNEVGQLRKLEGQKGLLEATNAGLREIEVKSETTLAQARALPNYWPKDQLAFAGFATPESTLKSMLTAMKNGDLNAFKDCLDPANAAQLEAELKEAGGDRTAKEAEMKSTFGDFLATTDGFHIVDQTATGSNEVTINLSFDGPGLVQKMVLRKVGNDWKFVN